MAQTKKKDKHKKKLQQQATKNAVKRTTPLQIVYIIFSIVMVLMLVLGSLATLFQQF